MWLGSSLTYRTHIFSCGSQDTKILAGERSGPFQSQNIETGMYWQQTYVASVLKVLFSEIVKLEGRIFQEKKWESFERQTHTHIHTQTQAQI